MKTYAIINQKGGVAKTSTALALGEGIARKGYKVLFVDLDPQGNLSYTLKANTQGYGALGVLQRPETAKDEIIDLFKNASIIASTPALYGADTTITQTGKEYRLKEALATIEEGFDFCIIAYETLTNVSPDQEFISVRNFLNIDNLSAVTFNPEKFKEYLHNILHIYFDLFKDSNEEQKELEEVFNNTFLEAINKLTAISLSFQQELFTAVSVKTKSAENVIFLEDKISQYIFNPAISYQAIALDKKKKDIASIKLSTSTEKDIQLFYKDKMTLEAIIALNEAGNTFITYGMIGKHMNPNASRITDSELTDIKNRVNRMRLTGMELVFKQPKKTSEGIITQYKGYLLNADEITFIANGKEASGIKINQPLIASWLYLWASDTGELQRMPISLIAPKIGNYDYAAALKNYLLRRITSMKKAPKLKRIILIKTIMENILDEKAYTESRLKHVRANIIQSTKDYLSELQNNGEISGYEITKKGNAVSAVKIKI